MNKPIRQNVEKYVYHEDTRIRTQLSPHHARLVYSRGGQREHSVVGPSCDERHLFTTKQTHANGDEKKKIVIIMLE